MVYLNYILLDNGTFIKIIGYKMCSSAYELHAAGKGLIIRLCTHECRQERMVNIHQCAHLEVTNEFRGQNAHVFGQDHKIRLAFVDGIQDQLLLLLARMICILKTGERNVEFCRKTSEILMISNHGHDVGI